MKTLIVENVEIQINEYGTIVYRNGKKANININADGYKVVTIKDRAIGMHRLVAMAYVDNDDVETKVEVNHKDFDRQNNHFSNLEWLSHADNVRYSHENGRHIKRYGEDNPNFGNTKLSKFYKDNPDVAKEKQSRKGLSNGRAKPIEILKDGKIFKKFDYISDCCDYLHEEHGAPRNRESVRSAIRQSIKHSREYYGFTFKK